MTSVATPSPTSARIFPHSIPVSLYQLNAKRHLGAAPLVFQGCGFRFNPTTLRRHLNPCANPFQRAILRPKSCHPKNPSTASAHSSAQQSSPPCRAPRLPPNHSNPSPLTPPKSSTTPTSA